MRAPKLRGARMPFVTIGPGPIEYDFVNAVDRPAGTMVTLHEGLGSLAMWKDFPQRLARDTQMQVLVYSRHGYGRSAPAKAPRSPDYLHHEALQILPELLTRLEVNHPVLFGHSDGASIALLHAAAHRDVRGVVAIAPHVMVEDVCVENIAVARRAYEHGGLRERLARYHDDVEGAFRGWNDLWLSEAFRSWNIESILPEIRCPILAVQGEQDEYATMAQLDRIAAGAARVQQLRLAQCGHSPHRDRPDALLGAVREWLKSEVGFADRHSTERSHSQ